MNKTKRFYSIVIFLIIAIVLLYIFVNLKSKNSDKETNDDYKQYDMILKSGNKKECSVNNEEITDRDIILTKYYNSDNANKAKIQTIEDKVLLQQLNKDNYKLNEKNETQIQNLIIGLKNSIEIKSNHYSEEERNELIESISNKLYNDALINQFKAEFISEIANKTFYTDDKEISKKYNECLKLQEKWKNRQGVSYGKLTMAREKVYKIYIQKLINNSTIKYKR